MNDIRTNTHYHVSAYDNCVCEDDYNSGTHEYSKGFEDNEYSQALKEYKRMKPLFDNVSLSKQTYITETIKEKKTEHVCEFIHTGYAQFFQEHGIGEGVIEILECKCSKKKDGEKIYIKRYDNE